MIKYLLLFLLFSLPSKAVTIEDSVNLAMQNSGDAAIIEAKNDLAFGTYLQSFSSLLPNVNYTISQRITNNTTQSGGQQNIFSTLLGGSFQGYHQLTASLDMSLYYSLPFIYFSGTNYKSALYSGNAKASELVNNVVQLYVNIAASREMLDAAKIAQKITTKKLEKSIILFDNKIISEIDLEQINVAVLETEANILQIESSLEKYESDYLFLTQSKLENTDLTKNYDTLPIQNIEEFEGLMMQKNQQLQVFKNDAEVSETQNTLSYLSLLPRFSLDYNRFDLGHGFVGNSTSISDYFGVSVMIPIFDRGQSWTNIYLASKKQKLANMTYSKQKQDIISGGKQIWVNYKSLTKITKAKQLYVDIAEKNLIKMKQNYKNKITSDIDLLTEEYNLLQKKIDLINMKKNQLISYYTILSMAGINPLVNYK